VYGIGVYWRETGGLEMSCQCCGGVLASELAAAMYELVCEMAVIERRHCHCDDVEGPLHVKLPREGRVEALSLVSCLQPLHRRETKMVSDGERVLVDDDERWDAV
jgi:hypothetical protein